MTIKKGTALVLVRADIPEDKQGEFNRWYNEEHLKEVLASPGYLSAARYVAVSGGPTYLACYELETPEAFESGPARRRRENPSDWSKRIDPNVIGTNFTANPESTEGRPWGQSLKKPSGAPLNLG